MQREIVTVKLTDEIKEEVLKVINETIDKVMSAHGKDVDNSLRQRVRNLALDQVNVNITSRANLKTLWILSDEDSIPYLVEKEKGLPSLDELASERASDKMFKMRPNLTWTFNRDNTKKGGVSKDKFEETAIKMLIEDVETAAFYGALSYAGEVNG